jgi:hypothetical protein
LKILSNRWIVIDPFVNYSGKVKITNRVYLSREEIKRIEGKEFATERLTQIRDVFLFCCFTGLGYATAETKV